MLSLQDTVYVPVVEAVKAAAAVGGRLDELWRQLDEKEQAAQEDERRAAARSAAERAAAANGPGRRMTPEAGDPYA